MVMVIGLGVTWGESLQNKLRQQGEEKDSYTCTHGIVLREGDDRGRVVANDSTSNPFTVFLDEIVNVPVGDQDGERAEGGG